MNDYSSSDDVFDRLPDEIVLSIFDKLHEARSLCLSMSVCKRFRSIAPLVDEIFLPIPQKRSQSDQETQRRSSTSSSFKNLVIRTLMKPLYFVSQMIKFKSRNEDENLDFYSYYVPNEILKSFEEIRTLHLRLPYQKQGGGAAKKNSTTFLKWKADFGRELHSCVILAAKTWSEKDENLVLESISDQESRVMGDEELKLRIVWTISCLIAASARHYLIKETVKGLKMIENVVVSDESDQGRLCMNREQIEELRELKGRSDEMQQVEQRSRVPALRMKMWYLERLELPGKVMEGATLVVIRPADEEEEEVRRGSRSEADMVAKAFCEEKDKDVGEAVRKLMIAKKCYVLEMNSF